MNKKQITFLISLFFVLLLAGCIAEENSVGANKLGDEVFVRESEGDFNSTRIAVTDYKFCDEVKTDEETIEPEEGKKFLLVHMETQILIEREEIHLEVNDQELLGIDSGNQTFSIKGNGSELTDYIGIVRNPSPIGLYPGAEIDGWVIFQVNEDIDLGQTYFRINPDVVGNTTIRWGFN